jgi:hypothetical protein
MKWGITTISDSLSTCYNILLLPSPARLKIPLLGVSYLDEILITPIGIVMPAAA